MSNEVSKDMSENLNDDLSEYDLGQKFDNIFE